MAITGDRLFVLEDYDGRIYELVEDGSGDVEAVLFLDLKVAIRAATGRQLDNTSLFHGGARGLAFHPDFDDNGRFYTSVMERRPAVPEPDAYLSDAARPIIADGVVIEWRADRATGEVDPDSYRQLFRIGMPVYDHPIKQIAFNPFAEPGHADRGLLYVAHGDGSVQSATAGGGHNNDALGKILRIDPLATTSAPYRVPDDNPFINDPNMLDEVWSLGHRNPHHLAFANYDDATMLISAEAGRDNIEEINVIERGGDYGWSDREGTFVHLASGGLVTGLELLPADDWTFGYTYPAAQVGHEGPVGAGFVGQALAGGFAVGNGSALDGEYFYSDFPRSGRVFHTPVAELAAAKTRLAPGEPPSVLAPATVGGVVVRFDHDVDVLTPPEVHSSLFSVFRSSPGHDGSNRADVRFGQGPVGELYVMSKRNGWVYAVTNSFPPTATTCAGRAPTIAGVVGTDGDDVLIGTDRDDRIFGGSGDDIICAGAGDDVVFAGSGRDRVVAGPGADVVDAGIGDDVVLGEAGRDRLIGSNGADLIRGGPGRDRLFGGQGSDRLYGGSAPDVIAGGDGVDRLFGNGGDDRLLGEAGRDRLGGGAGADVLDGGTDVDRCVRGHTLRSCETLR